MRACGHRNPVPHPRVMLRPPQAVAPSALVASAARPMLVQAVLRGVAHLVAVVVRLAMAVVPAQARTVASVAMLVVTPRAVQAPHNQSPARPPCPHQARLRLPVSSPCA